MALEEWDSPSADKMLIELQNFYSSFLSHTALFHEIKEKSSLTMGPGCLIMCLIMYLIMCLIISLV